MKRIALTGGIACGKSLLAKYLNELGVETIDADDVVHELIPDPCERRRLAAEVFADPEKRRALEARLHPLVKAKILAWQDLRRETEDGSREDVRRETEDARLTSTVSSPKISETVLPENRLLSGCQVPPIMTVDQSRSCASISSTMRRRVAASASRAHSAFAAPSPAQSGNTTSRSVPAAQNG